MTNHADARATEYSIADRIAKLQFDIRHSIEYAVQSAKLDIADRIYDLMCSKDMSKSDLARSLGKSRPYISKMLGGGENFTIESLVRICDVMECELSDLIPQKSVSLDEIVASVKSNASAFKNNTCRLQLLPSLLEGTHRRLSKATNNKSKEPCGNDNADRRILGTRAAQKHGIHPTFLR